MKIYSRYQGFRLNVDGSLDGHENLDNFQELEEWLDRTRYPSSIVKSNKGAFTHVTYNGDSTEVSEPMPLDLLDAFLIGYSRS